MTWHTANLEPLLRSLVQSAPIPAISVATVRGGAVESAIACGVRDTASAVPIDHQTVFEAASLSKPVVAYAALQLADMGKLDLDQPLSAFLPPPSPGDAAAARITTRHVLAHTSGLPNWRRAGVLPRTHFTPGSRFSYSGEAFVYLQSVTEMIENEPLDSIVKRLVFDPLSMARSSFVWQSRFEPNFASPHEDSGQRADKFKPATANAAYSLNTTPSDYARFMLAVLSGDRLESTTATAWLTPQTHAPKGRTEALEYDKPEVDEDVAWGLGWGLELEAGAFFHWGANPGATAFVIGIPRDRQAFAVFVNSDSGLEVAAKLVRRIVPGSHPSLSWLGLGP